MGRDEKDKQVGGYLGVIFDMAISVHERGKLLKGYEGKNNDDWIHAADESTREPVDADVLLLGEEKRTERK